MLLPENFPLEGKAVAQLLDFRLGAGATCQRACLQGLRTPDFHPGSIAPVGTIVATSPDLVIPAAIGTDINCGMRLLTTGLRLEQAEAGREALVRKLTRVLLQDGHDVPMTARAFTALFDSGPGDCLQELTTQGIWARADRTRLQRTRWPPASAWRNSAARPYTRLNH